MNELADYNQTHKNWKTGYVYVIDYGDGADFKIGCTKNDPANRLKQIMGTSVVMPMSLVMTGRCDTNHYYVENLAHMRFDYCHKAGEWFEFDVPTLVDLWYFLDATCDQLELHDRWYEIMGDDWSEYVLHLGIGIKMPEFAKRDIRDHKAMIKHRREVLKYLVEAWQ